MRTSAGKKSCQDLTGRAQDRVFFFPINKWGLTKAIQLSEGRGFEVDDSYVICIHEFIIFSLFLTLTVSFCWGPLWSIPRLSGDYNWYHSSSVSNFVFLTNFLQSQDQTCSKTNHLPLLPYLPHTKTLVPSIFEIRGAYSALALDVLPTSRTCHQPS